MCCLSKWGAYKWMIRAHQKCYPCAKSQLSGYSLVRIVISSPQGEKSCCWESHLILSHCWDAVFQIFILNHFFFFLINHLNECPVFFTYGAESESVSKRSLMRKRTSKIWPGKKVSYKGSKYSISTVLIRIIWISED